MKTVLLQHRRLASETAQTGLAAASLVAAFLLRFEFTLDPRYARMLLGAMPLLLIVKFLVFRAFGLRDLAWRYLGFQDLGRIAAANLAASAAATLVLRSVLGSGLPRSIHILDFLLCLTLMVAARGLARVIFEPHRHETPPRRILIYGAGKAGATVLSEIRANPQLGYEVAGFLDDDPGKRICD